MKPLHVGLVCSTYPPIVGGVEAYNRHVAQALAAQGHRVTVATRFVHARPAGMRRLLTTSAEGERFDDGAVAVHVLKADRPAALAPVYRLHFYRSTWPLARRLFDAAYGAPLARALQGCDVVHVSGTGREMLGFSAARFAARRGLPLLVTGHPHLEAWGDGPLDLHLYRRADRYLAITAAEKRHLAAKGLCEARIDVLGHGVGVAGTGDGVRFRETYGLTGPMVLFLGRQSSYKGLPLLLDAAPLVWTHVPDAHLVIAGPPTNEALTEARRRVLSDPRVVNLGFVDDATREAVYAAADVFCLPSSDEAFGLAYLDAWAYGVPVVALDLPTLREWIGAVQPEGLVPPRPDALAAALRRLLTDIPLRGRLSEAVRAAARERTWARVAERLAEIYARRSTD